MAANIVSILIFVFELFVFSKHANKVVLTSTQANSIAASIKVRHIFEFKQKKSLETLHVD